MVVNYSAGNGIIYSNEKLKSNLFDYHGANILVRGNITIAGNIAAQVAFINCITQLDGTTIG